MPPRIVIVGLGPGSPKDLTQEARETLMETRVLYLRTERHPVVAHLPPHLELRPLDECYEQGQDFAQVYHEIVHRLLDAPENPVIYGVPGHPLIAETTTRLLLQQLGKDNVRIVAGLSFFGPVCTALSLDPLDRGLQLLDALSLKVPDSPFELPPIIEPTRPLLVAQLHNRITAAELKLVLMEHYPVEHVTTIVQAAGIPEQETIWSVPLHDLDRDGRLDHLCTLYIPPIEQFKAQRETRTLEWVCARLRGPGGCPWDREQDHASLRDNLLEECYEVLEALDQDDLDRLCEEMGDLLMQIFLHAQLGREEGSFSLPDVVEGISSKLIRRHPHVFAEWPAANSEEVCRNWEEIKATERRERGKKRASLLDGVPKMLPALAYAQAIGRRAARVGFDWNQVEEVWDKVREEMGELSQATHRRDREEELGDLLFALVNLARWLDVEAEDALRATNAKFHRRFGWLEQKALRDQVSLEEMEIDEMDALWEEAKEGERQEDPPRPEDPSRRLD
jgi:tetrapyrrole methylase family protein/MazG family protein